MVRTKADGGARKAVAAKAPRKSLGGEGGGGSRSAILSPKAAGKKYAGGNIVFERPTPEWQKGIMNFLIQSSKPTKIDKENDNPEDDSGAGTSAKRDIEICEEIKEQNEEVENNEEKMDKDDGENNEEKMDKDDGEEEVENNEEKMDKDDGEDATNIAESSSSNFQKNNCIDDSDDDE